MSSSEKPRTFTSRRGAIFNLRPINSLVIYQLRNDRYGEPQPPLVEVAVGPKGQKRKEVNPDDPDYLERRRKWEEARGNNFIKYVWERGVTDQPPADDLKRLKEFLPHASASDLKYMWIAEQMDDDEIGDLTEAITAQTAPTEAGIAEAEATFPSES